MQRVNSLNSLNSDEDNNYPRKNIHHDMFRSDHLYNVTNGCLGSFSHTKLYIASAQLILMTLIRMKVNIEQVSACKHVQGKGNITRVQLNHSRKTLSIAYLHVMATICTKNKEGKYQEPTQSSANVPHLARDTKHHT